jgi:hypothetical protein
MISSKKVFLAALCVLAIVLCWIIVDEATGSPPVRDEGPPRDYQQHESPVRQWASEELGLGSRALTPREILYHGNIVSDFYAVNIGALEGNYDDGDPVNKLWLVDGGNWTRRGLAIEGVDTQCATLRGRLRPVTNVSVACTFVDPYNVLAVFASYGVPRSFDFLKLDIDSIDCPVLDTILTTYRPRYIHMETNYEIPPPVIFSLEYSPALTKSWFWCVPTPHPFTATVYGKPFKSVLLATGPHAAALTPLGRKTAGAGGFYGCSLSRVAQIGRKYGYTVIQVHQLDVDLVHSDRLPAFGRLTGDLRGMWQRGVQAWCTPRSHMGMEGACATWFNLPPEEAYRSVWTHLMTVVPAAQLRAVPFRLGLDYE